jgi:hypothetical protein
MHSPKVAAFLGAVGRDKSLWASVDVRLVAVLADGTWHNLFTHATLKSEPQASVPALFHPISSSVLRGEQHVLPIEELPRFLDSVEASVWPRENPITYVTGQFNFGTVMGYEFREQQFREVDQLYGQLQLNWAAQLLVAGGEGTSSIIGRVPGGYDELQNAARHHHYPLQTLDHLVRHVLGVSQTVAGANAFCRVVAPYEVRIEPGSVHLNEGTASISVFAASRAAAEAARLQLTTNPPTSEIPAVSLLPPVAEWASSNPGVCHWTGKFSVGGVDEVSFSLACGTQSIQWVNRHAFHIGGQSVPLRLYQVLDPNLELLRSSLVGRGRDSSRQTQLEEAIGRLLTLGGFLVDRFSAKKLADGVDLIAYAPDDLVCLAVECTTHAITASGKLSKLVARAAELQQASQPIPVHAVIATSLAVEAIASPDWEAARSSRVLVITRETFAEMLLIIKSGGLTGDLLKQITGSQRR